MSMNKDKRNSDSGIIGVFILLMAVVVLLSIVSNSLWGGKPETIPQSEEFEITEGMTVQDFGEANNLQNPILRQVFDLQTSEDLQNPLSDYGSPDEIQALTVSRIALAAEEASKNWVKIAIKFAVWFAFLISVFFIFKNRKVTRIARFTALGISVLLFGIVLGSDPSPMGTVKDAIYLYATTGAVFKQRLIALFIFLLIVFLANKYICSWGCQAGVLQDLIYRLNQDPKRKSILGKQIKVPFLITNTVRVAFFAVFTVLAFGWGFELIEPIDLFKIYNPAHLTLIGILAVAVIYIASLFIYRPWCHFACPFGLVGWIVEKISLVKISVDYDTCIACQQCAKACPSTVMNAILKREVTTIPDCFSCYTCRDVCPTNSIQFSTRKRKIPPRGFFDKGK